MIGRGTAVSRLILGAGLLLAGPGLRAAVQPLVANEELPAAVLPGPLRLNLRLSLNRDRGQPLLAVGDPRQGSLLFWLWGDDGTARIGLADTGDGVLFSRPFAAEPDAAHVLDVAWGALWTEPAAGLAACLRDTLWIAVDGRPVLFRKQAFGVRSRRVLFGANVIGSGFAGAYFNGSAATVERADAQLVLRTGMGLMDLLGGRDPAAGAYPGALRMRLSLPPGTAGQSEPLLIAGHPGSAAILYVHYDDERHFRLGFDTWGLRGPLSAPIEFQPGKDGDLRLSIGVFYPVAIRPPQAAAPPLSLLPSELWAEWNGRPVLATIAFCPSIPPREIAVGANLLGWNLTGPAFRGLISRIERIDPAAVAGAIRDAVFRQPPAAGPAWQGYPGAVRLRVAFPETWRAGTAEPLVVAGPTGAADILYVSYEDEGWVHFGLDHWGGASVISGRMAVAPGSEHDLTVELGSLLPPDGATRYARRPDFGTQRETVRLDLDGKTVLNGRRSLYRVSPEQITYGINLAGGSTSGPAFMGRILSLARVPWEVQAEAGQATPGGQPEASSSPAALPTPGS